MFGWYIGEGFVRSIVAVNEVNLGIIRTSLMLGDNFDNSIFVSKESRSALVNVKICDRREYKRGGNIDVGPRVEHVVCLDSVSNG